MSIAVSPPERGRGRPAVHTLPTLCENKVIRILHLKLSEDWVKRLWESFLTFTKKAFSLFEVSNDGDQI